MLLMCRGTLRSGRARCRSCTARRTRVLDAHAHTGYVEKIRVNHFGFLSILFAVEWCDDERNNVGGAMEDAPRSWRTRGPLKHQVRSAATSNKRTNTRGKILRTFCINVISLMLMRCLQKYLQKYLMRESVQCCSSGIVHQSSVLS